MEQITSKVRQSTLCTRAAKHAAMEVLELTPPAEGCQSGWFNYKDDLLRPRAGH